MLLMLLSCFSWADGLALVHSQVNWHVKTPQWQDEMKLNLPDQLTTKTHLFFTFFQINCQFKKDAKSTEELIGYAFLPLYSKTK